MGVTDVVLYKGAYGVSAEGTVVSYKRTMGPCHGNKTVVDKSRPRIMTVKTRPDGYLQVQIDGKWRYLHRVVYEAFCGSIPPRRQVRHLDGDKANNTLSNLALGTQSENEYDKWGHGVMPHGGTHHNAKLTEDKVKRARQLYAEKWQQDEIIEELSLACSTGTLNDAIIGRTWRHVPGAVAKRGRTKMDRDAR